MKKARIQKRKRVGFAVAPLTDFSVRRRRQRRWNAGNQKRSYGHKPPDGLNLVGRKGNPDGKKD